MPSNIKDEFTINLRGLTIDAKLVITKALQESQDMCPDEDNAIALIVIKQFDEDNLPNNREFTSDFETMGM